MQEEPFAMLRKDSAFHTGNERFEGFFVDIIRELAVTVGFNYELRLVQDGLFGSKDYDNGTWTGAIGELLRQVLY